MSLAGALRESSPESGTRRRRLVGARSVIASRRRAMQHTAQQGASRPETFERRPFPAARQAVARKTRFSGLVGCLLFALIFVATLAAVVGFIAATLVLDYGGELVGVGLVVVVLVSAIPWVVYMVRKAGKTRKVLAAMPCPECARGMTLTIDDKNAYALVCGACRAIWATDVAAPGDTDHHSHHQHIH